MKVSSDGFVQRILVSSQERMCLYGLQWMGSVVAFVGHCDKESVPRLTAFAARNLHPLPGKSD